MFWSLILSCCRDPCPKNPNLIWVVFFKEHYWYAHRSFVIFWNIFYLRNFDCVVIVVCRIFVDIEGWDVQFLSFAEVSIEDIAVQEANIIKFYDQEIRVIMAEYLVAIMLDVGGDKYNSRAKSFIEQDAVKIPELEILIERFHLEESWQKLRQKLK